MDNLIGVSIGNYRIVEQLGRGGMANVYKAFHEGLAVHRALKVIRPDLVHEQGFHDRFQLEARAIAALRHPNIVQINDFGEQDGLFYMVMEFVEGENLRDRIQRLGPIRPFAEALRIVEKVAAALGYAHDTGILHRDVKPENILLTADGEPILADFGIAKMLASTDAKLTATGIGIGTPAYMAPEIACGRTDLGPAVDLYACGVVLYEALTGRTPFAAETPLAVLQQVINDPAPPPREFTADIPDALQGVVLKAMEKDPALRYPNADAFIEACSQSLLGLGPQSAIGIQPVGTAPGRPFAPPPIPPAHQTDENAPTQAFDYGDTKIPPTLGGAEDGVQPPPPPVPPASLEPDATIGVPEPEDVPTNRAMASGRGPRRWLLAAAVAALFLVAFSTAAVMGVRKLMGGDEVRPEDSIASTAFDSGALSSDAVDLPQASDDDDSQPFGSANAGGSEAGDSETGGYSADPPNVSGTIDVSSIREEMSAREAYEARPEVEQPGNRQAERGARGTERSDATGSRTISTETTATDAVAALETQIARGGRADNVIPGGLSADEAPTARRGQDSARSLPEDRRGEPPTVAHRFDAVLDVDQVLSDEIPFGETARLGIEFRRPMRVLFDIVIANKRGRYILTGPGGEQVFEQLGNDFGPFRIETPGVYELTVEMEDESDVPLYYEVQFRRAEW